MLKVEIDPGSGFCGGVIRAISRAEDELSRGGKLYSLGAIVHNEEELSRLSARGLVTVSSLAEVPEGASILIRAHGEPPSTYEEAAARHLTVIDCSCPVVLQLQRRIREAYARLHEGGRHGQILIFGRVGHAEVLGLLGQVGGDALVVEDASMLSAALADGRLSLDEPLEIFSQTTNSLENALAAIALFVAITELEGLVLTGGSTAGNSSHTNKTGIKGNFNFDGRISAGIQDFSTENGYDLHNFIKI